MTSYLPAPFDPQVLAHRIDGPGIRHRIDLPEVRGALPARAECYWMSIGLGRSLGFRKGRTWRWHASMYPVGKQTSRRRWLGYTPDTPATHQAGETLSFQEAIARANAWVDSFDDAKPAVRTVPDDLLPVAPAHGEYLVAHAAIAYLATLEPKGEEWRRTRSVISRHIIPGLGDIEVSALEARDVQRWHYEVAASPTYGRSTDGGLDSAMPDAALELARRKRRKANNYLYVLRSILDLAYFEGHAQSAQPWRSVPVFKRVAAPRKRILTTEEIAQLLNACDPCLSNLVAGALSTGCRLSELICLASEDLGKGSGKLRVRDGKWNRVRHVILSDSGTKLFGSLIRDRAPGDTVFKREDARLWTRSAAGSRLRRASEKSGLGRGICWTGLRHTYASMAARAGMPIRALAQQLGHRNAHVTEQYYVQYSETEMDHEIRTMLPEIGVPGLRLG